MSYGLKYIMQWVSQNANANDYRIELYQKDYSGDTTVKKLGSAPSLVIDNADNGIMGTSLQFSIQADIDGELQELYTTDAKKFKCLLFKNDNQIWAGYLLQELYSEDYIAAPYDVGVTATDQLALLKDVPYAPIGRKTLLEVIHNAITPTQLELGYSVQTSLKPQLQDSDIPFISFVTIDDGGYINYSCYEVISMIMRTCNMTITQIENSWVIARKSDISAEIFRYDSALNLIGQAEPNALVIGQMYENDIWPVGNLVRKFTAVPKTLKFAFSPIVKSSFFDNPTMEGPEYWQTNGTYIEQAPGKYKVTVNRLEYNYNVNAWILRSSNRKTKDFALWQSIDVEQGGASLSLKVSYCPMLFISPVTTTSAKKVQEAKLTVQIKLETDSAEVYYMTKEGWKLEDAGDLTYTANPVTDDLRQRGNKDQYSSAVINFPAIPANGVLTISFRNDSLNYIKSDASNMEPYYEPYLMGVTDVMLTAPDVVGYDSDVILNAQGNSSVEQELFFSDAYGIGNEEKSLYNFIRIGDSDTSDWLLGKSTFETFFKAMVQDTANLANLKNHYSGVISGTQQIGLLYYEKFSGDILRMERGTLDLLTEDLNGEWLQVPVSDAVYDEFELNTNENNVVKPASVSTSIPTGNFASTDALDALTKIVNILNTIIGLDDDDNAYVKSKSDGTPRNFYTYGTMSFGGIDDGESGEGGGTGITSLYDIPEIAVSVATLADGQSLVYDATLRKWVNRLVQSGGSGVDMDYVWAALAGATDEKINASHIPDLSSVYLPLTGGYMHGSILFDSGAGIRASNSNSNIQIGMYQNNGIFLQGPRLLYSPASDKDYTIWHAGNDGYGSGLDADLLDGSHLSDIHINIFKRNDWNKLPNDADLNDYIYANSQLGYYVTNDSVNYTNAPYANFGLLTFSLNTNFTGQIVFPYGRTNKIMYRAQYYTSNGDAWSDWKTVAFTDSTIANAEKLGNYDETRFFRRRSILYSYDSGSALPLGLYMLGNTESETDYFPTGNGTFINLTSTDDSGAVGTNYGLQFCTNYAAGALYVRSVWYNSLKSWKQLAYVTSNVNSATKLQTARKIWGRTFDGTGNITSHLELGNSIAIKVTDDGDTLRNALVMDSYNSLLIGSGNVASDAGYMTHIYGKPIRFSISSSNHPVTITSNANVLIGTTNEDITYNEDIAYKLLVNGRGYFSAGATLKNGNAIYSKDTSGADKALFLLNNANSFMIGSDIGAAEYSTYLYGHEILFRQKPGGAQPMYISSNGNVLIGYTTDDNSAKLKVNGSIYTSSYISFGYYGKQLTEDPTSTFRTTMFGDSTAGARLRTFRADEAFGLVAAKYGAGLAWSTVDTHAYINVDHMSSEIVYIGGGNQGKLNWQARLFTSKMSLIPDSTGTYDLGSSNNRWNTIYAASLNLSGNISSGSILPITTNAYTLGSTALRWSSLFANNVNTGYLYTADGNTKVLEANGSLMSFGDDYLTEGLPVYFNGGTIHFRTTNTIDFRTTDVTDLSIGSNGVAAFYKRSAHNEGLSLAADKFIYTTNSAEGLLKTFGVQDEQLLIGFETSTSASYDTFIYGNNISFKYGGTTNVALTINNEGNAIFYNSIKIGDATLVWDAVNQCLVVDKNFAADGSISFGGIEPPTEDNYLSTNGGTILGNLGIGNAANTGKNLNMYGSIYFYLNSNPTAYKMQLSMDGNSRLALRDPTDYAATKFYVYGDIIYNGTCGKPSDMRLKHVIEHVCLSSEIIANAPLFRYKRKDSDDDRVYIGSSAQYWQEVAPELTPLVDDYLTLDYATLGVVMGKSNATEIEKLKAEVKELRLKVENYERMLNN